MSAEHELARRNRYSLLIAAHPLTSYANPCVSTSFIASARNSNE